MNEMDANGAQDTPYSWSFLRTIRSSERLPMTSEGDAMSTDEAVAYARWVGKRLPSDAEWVKARRAELDKQGAAAASSANAMKCPRCGNALTEREFQNVKLDACDRCKGVWFDAGELELVLLLKKADQIRVVSGLAK